MAADSACHNADRTCPGNEDIFTDQVKHQGCMRSIAKRIKKGNNLFVYLRADGDAVGGGYAQILGKSAIPVDTYAFCVLTPLRIACAAVTAMSADNMAFTRYTLTNVQALNVAAQFCDFTNIFMPDHSGRVNMFLTPAVPLVNMQVSTADCCFVNFYQYFIVRRGRFFYPHQFQSGLSFSFCKCIHHHNNPLLYCDPVSKASSSCTV